MTEYNLLEPWKSLDPWQIKYIKEVGNCFLLCGRQVGKTTAMSIKAVELCVNQFKKGENILIISITEKQGYLMLAKAIAYATVKYPHLIAKKDKKPTKHVLNFTKGNAIYCYAAGETGEGLRGFTIKKLMIDEGSRMSEEFFVAVDPMLSVIGGSMDIASTPFGAQGYFWRCSERKDFTHFYVSAEDCPRHTKEKLAKAKEHMTKLQYAQEYLAQFLKDLIQYFPTVLIKKCQTLDRAKAITPVFGDRFLGVDIAGMGEDDTVLLSLNRLAKKRVKQFDMIVTTKTRTTDTFWKIRTANERYHYKKIYIDDGGMGVGVFDMLLASNPTKRKVVAINNARRSIDNEDVPRQKGLMKEDLYNNLLNLMEQGRIELFKGEDILHSLKSIQFERKDGKTKIFGRDTHITEALIRAAWCMKDKSLNIYVL